MAKSMMGYMVRAWNNELKSREWNMGNKKRRKAFARELAAASLEMDNDVADAVEAEFRVQEEVSDWGR
ncbi:hypothetical protein F6804_13075 [Salmonella enterica]|nr:hypothetical protein [Salmonella enterica]EIK0944037.1 hypothetical protein [Salmonella enterica]EMA3598404.1 hypothetical protein [Salmonella enterica]